MKKIFFAALVVIICLSAACAADTKVTKITGIASLGSTKTQVLESFGKPDSPQKYDFYYEKMNSEIIVTFNDKTSLAESIIVRGQNPKYAVNGIKVGSTKNDVAKAFGKPEKKFVYKKSDTECWYYPSQNLGFAFNNGKVASFSVNNINY